MPTSITEADFQVKVLEQSKNKPVLVDFWAPWCAPCKMLTPVLESVAITLGEETDIVKINVDENPVIAGSYSIRSIPTMIVFRHGIEAERAVGVLSREDITNIIKKHI